MTRHRVGLWLVGAFGGVGTTITLGLSAMARGLSDRTGLVTELPLFRGPAAAGAGRFRHRRPRHPPDVVRANRPRNSAATRASSRRAGSRRAATSWPPPRRGSAPGPASASGRPIAAAGGLGRAPSRPGRRGQAVDRIAADMAAFVEAEVDRPPDRPERRQHRAAVRARRGPRALGHAERRAADGGPELLPASSLYALAALRAGYTYINFTPSLGRSLPALARAGRVAPARSTPARTARPARR